MSKYIVFENSKIPDIQVGVRIPVLDEDDNYYYFIDEKSERRALTKAYRGYDYYISHDTQDQPPQEPLPVNDPVNPNHYKTGGIETIEFMQAKLSPEAFEGYLAGNVIKYITRYRHKNGVEDLKKGQWYLNRLIELQSQ